MAKTQSKTSQLKDYVLLFSVALSMLLIAADVGTKALDNLESDNRTPVPMTTEAGNEIEAK